LRNIPDERRKIVERFFFLLSVIDNFILFNFRTIEFISLLILGAVHFNRR
jgi:hypothetical protein